LANKSNNASEAEFPSVSSFQASWDGMRLKSVECLLMKIVESAHLRWSDSENFKLA